MSVDAPVRALFWMPGCSSCLRLKEFVERTGIKVDEINIDAEPERRAELEQVGVWPPAIRVGDRYANGLNLDEVAALLGVEYEAAAPLRPAELHDRYLAVQAVYAKVLTLMPVGYLQRSLPGRDRTMADVAAQVSAVMRAFLAAYETGKHDNSFYLRPDDVRSVADLRTRADQTVAMFTAWWEQDGFDDPLDNVVSTFWGHHTLHEVLEREVWHTTQHLRQLVYVLDEVGVEHDIDLKPLMVGLPMPERVHD
ncbi:MAG TPA: glutaredoxin domain-containing protein [Jatrophihabitantaceae bacterium]|nr:glutaredoxin domain-containing protein [Jatrophihabitantaceae bacterium]